MSTRYLLSSAADSSFCNRTWTSLTVIHTVLYLIRTIYLLLNQPSKLIGRSYSKITKISITRSNGELLKYGFCSKSFRKDEPLTNWTLLQHIFPHFWTWLLNAIAITPKSEDRYVVKVFNWSEVHLSEMTCYKIQTLTESLNKY